MSFGACVTDLKPILTHGELPRSNGKRPDTPPVHGNWGDSLPTVYRWAYDYSVPGAEQDFIPQNTPEEEGPTMSDDGTDKEA